MNVLVTGSNGQLGRALQKKFPNSVFTDSNTLDITDGQAINTFDFSGIEAIVNAAAYTNVDGCELPDNVQTAWNINVQGVINLAHKARELDIPLVHVSTDYVFDGDKDEPYLEDDAINPLSIYGQTKAASEWAARFVPKHYIIRTSWVVGDGKNFVRTMLMLAEKGINPSVVSDQVGRPTFTPVLAEVIQKLLTEESVHGIYNASNDGEPVSWADFTRAIFKEIDAQNNVTHTTTEEYFADKPLAATRPKNSVLDLTKIKKTGIKLPNWQDSLDRYLNGEQS